MSAPIRTKRTKTAETAIDTGLITAGVVFAFALLRERYGLTPATEAAGVAFFSAALAGFVRLTRSIYREWRYHRQHR